MNNRMNWFRAALFLGGIIASAFSADSSFPNAAIYAAEEPRPQLQIINGTDQTVDIFWLKSDTERVANGSVEPGKNTVITTTLGHRFAIVGQRDKSEST